MVYKGKKRQRGGVYKGSKRQRGGFFPKKAGKLARKTKNKIIKSFKQAEAFITQKINLAKKGKKQIGGSIIGPRFAGPWGRKLGRNVDRFYI